MELAQKKCSTYKPGLAANHAEGYGRNFKRGARLVA